jgi:hypothetical protein
MMATVRHVTSSSGLKDVVKIKIELSITKVHFVGLHCMIMENETEGVVLYVHASQTEQSG